MIKKVLLGLLALVLLVIAAGWVVGSAILFDQPAIPEPVASARPMPATPSGSTGDKPPQILFGDLHVHTSYSIDAAIFSIPISKGTPYTTPADACDYARYCSGLDFYSINDHAEGLGPWQWQATKKAIRQCNAATDPAAPDMVAFLGWEWTQGSESPNAHYGHKNVMFLDQEEDRVPTRVIGSGKDSIWRQLGNAPTVVRGLAMLAGSRLNLSGYESLAQHFQTISETPDCPEGDVRELAADCNEDAATPQALFGKLDQWGFEALVIPHGLSWSTTNPLGADFKYQMDSLNNKYQRLLETYSGHGNSEIYRDLPVVLAGAAKCPEPVEGFTACCWRAGEIIQQRCTANGDEDCDARAVDTRAKYLQAMNGKLGMSPHRTVVKGTTANDWGQCDQLVDAFQPAHNYQPKQSAQYILTLDEEGQRFRPGFIGSSDNHTARPGSSYKELSRYYITDTKMKETPPKVSDLLADEPQDPARFMFEDDEDAGNAFFFTGGLVAVHSTGRTREDIWDALQRRSVYGTSGPRIKLWFDMVEEDGKRHGMGSDVAVGATPTFKVSAMGSLKQKPGCPAYVTDALGAQRVESLCRSECLNPGDEAYAIERIEVVRVLPRTSIDQKTEDLIEDPWRVFECDAESAECSAEFRDEDFVEAGRDATYYARAIQEATDTIQGDPFGCEFNAEGKCVKTNYCMGVSTEEDCLSPAQHRAWSSPIYLSVNSTSSQESVAQQ